MKQFFTKFSRRTWIIIGVVVVVALAAVFIFSTRGEPVSVFQTTKAERGNLVATVGATVAQLFALIEYLYIATLLFPIA